MAETGYAALVLALVACLYSIIAYISGLRGSRQRLLDSARKSLFAASALVSLAVVVLLIALVSHYFRIEYVYAYTSTDLPLPYLISALWAGNAGSLLFWSWLLSLCAAVVVLKKQARAKELVPYAAIVIMVVQVFFLILLIFMKNPFHTITPAPTEGFGLNPQLENIGMIVHPPALLAGYVLFAVPFAFALAALFIKKLDNDWLMATRRWTLLAWLLLGVGNIIGAWWAYVELGWGGYWAWDPVENAGLMPWILATALVHSVMMQRRKGMFKLWSMVLIVLVFAFTIFGTFLTRTGILVSVHAFAGSAMGPLFATFLGIALLGPLALIFYRRKELKDEAEVNSFFSREGAFFTNNLLLVGLTFLILLGTVFGLGKPFFNLTSIPIFLAIILLSGFCALTNWRPPPAERLRRNLLWLTAAALVVVAALLLFGIRQWLALVGGFLFTFVILAILSQWFQDWRTRHQRQAGGHHKSFWDMVWSNKSRYGGFLVHIAIVLIAIGVTGSSLFDTKAEAVLAPGKSMAIKDYTLTYEGLEAQPTPSKMIIYANVSVDKGDRSIGTMRPQVQFNPDFTNQDTGELIPFYEVDIRSTPVEDLYVILAGWEPVDSADSSKGYIADFSVLVNPLVMWIWIGGGVFLLGGLLAFWPERKR